MNEFDSIDSIFISNDACCHSVTRSTHWCQICRYVTRFVFGHEIRMKNSFFLRFTCAINNMLQVESTLLPAELRWHFPECCVDGLINST